MKLFNMLQNVSLSDGFSWDLRNDCAPTAGYAVSCSKDTELVLDHCPSALEIADYVIEHGDELLGYIWNNELGMDETPNTVLGLWEDNGKWYLDVSDIFESREHALSVGKNCNQIAIFDIEALQSIYIDYSADNIILGSN